MEKYSEDVLEERYMKDLRLLYPKEDGRRLRGIAHRLSKVKDIIEREELLVMEFGVEPRYERGPDGSIKVREMAHERRRRSEILQRNSVSAQGAGERGRG